MFAYRTLFVICAIFFDIVLAQFCEVPFESPITKGGPIGSQGYKCNFGSSSVEGWKYVGLDGTTLSNLKGCLSIEEASPSPDALSVYGLEPSTKWCPVGFGTSLIDQFEEGQTQSWGVCECESCRVNPQAEPAGLVSMGLCSFHGNDWSYQFDNGTLVSNLKGCVDMTILPPQGYYYLFSDGVFPPSKLWCPTTLDANGVYFENKPICTQSEEEEDECGPMGWGVCECFGVTEVPTQSPQINISPTRSPLAPTPSGESVEESLYCEIMPSVDAPLQSGNCNFGPMGEWNYLALDFTEDQGLAGCVPMTEFPPASGLVDSTRNWCPGRFGLDNTNTFAMPNSNWGVCRCASCRIISSTVAPVQSGLCNFGISNEWKYRFPNNTVHLLKSSVSVWHYPPQNQPLNLPFDTLWCPGPTALDTNQEYRVSQPSWGISQCLTPSEEVTPSSRPTTQAPSKLLPTVRPTTPVPTTRLPSLSPTPQQAYCVLSHVPNGNNALEDTLCGIAGGWEYLDDLQQLPGKRFGATCVSADLFPPFNLRSDISRWCPSKDGVDELGVYHTKDLDTADRLAWGECTCKKCSIVSPPVVDDFFGQTKGECNFGSNGEWYFVNEQGVKSSKLVGCVTMSRFTPFGAFDLAPDTKWCPNKNGLDQDNVYNAMGSGFSDPLGWGLCACQIVDDDLQEYEDQRVTSSPGGELTSYPSRSPLVTPPTTQYPTNKPVTRFPTKQPRSQSPTVPPTNYPTSGGSTKPPTCCTMVDKGGPKTSGVCDFGMSDTWSYKVPKNVRTGLSGCVSVDMYPPKNLPPSLRDTNTFWCPGTLDNQNVYTNHGNWGVCECSCLETQTPTIPHMEQQDRLALFIQADHSGSIKTANPSCKERTYDPVTGKAFNCWELQATFISNLVRNFTDMYGPDNFRLYLSTFSCIQGTPIYNVLSKNGLKDFGLTDQGKPDQITKTLQRFWDMSERGMAGTCPSKGANRIFFEMEKVKIDWPVSYFIVTDGEVSYPDKTDYSRAVERIKKQLRPRNMKVCAATVGVANANEITKLMRTKCVFSAASFVEISEGKFARDFSDLLLGKEFHMGIDDGDTFGSGLVYVPEDPPFSKTATPTTAQDVTVVATTSNNNTAITVLASSLTLIGVLLLFAVGMRKKFISSRRKSTSGLDKSRSEGTVKWMDNPMMPDEWQHGRRRSRAGSSSAVDVFTLPSPPPLSQQHMVHFQAPMDGEDLEAMSKAPNTNRKGSLAKLKTVATIQANRKRKLENEAEADLAVFE